MAIFSRIFRLFGRRNLYDYDELYVDIDNIGEKYGEWDNSFVGIGNQDKQKAYERSVSEDRDFSDKKFRLMNIKSNCEQIINANKNIDETVKEYAAVTAYLSDVQKIEMAGQLERKRIYEAAIKIHKLKDEAEKIVIKKAPRIKQAQYNILEQYEDDIVDEIDNMKRYEDEYKTIKSDLSILEGERADIIYELRNLLSYQKFLKVFSKFALVLIMAVFFIIIMLEYSSDIDMSIAILFTTFAAAGSAIFVVVSSRKTEYNIKLNEAKMNKLIGLFNRVKIKCFNSRNLIDYVHSKYDVRNSKELSNNWNKYIILKDTKNKQEKNNELLDVYEKSLVTKLKEIKVEDADVWLNQIDALLNKREMDEIKKRLETRRNKLKERIDYNNKLVDEGKEEIKGIIKGKDEYRLEVANILREYSINV